MVKLCHIFYKVSMPHHIVDDVMDLLREFQIKNMQRQPEKLLKCSNFLNHLEKHFYSPIAQSIAVGLESFWSIDVLYSGSYRDSAEILWYDFKEQAMDFNDANIWGNLDHFQGTIDPKNIFLASLLEKMDAISPLTKVTIQIMNAFSFQCMTMACEYMLCNFTNQRNMALVLRYKNYMMMVLKNG